MESRLGYVIVRRHIDEYDWWLELFSIVMNNNHIVQYLSGKKEFEVGNKDIHVNNTAMFIDIPTDVILSYMED